MSSKNIVVLGSLHYDIFIESDKIPEVGETVLGKKWYPKLGGKGANLAEMSNIGIPVPPGFTITTEVCNYYYQINHQIFA